MTSPTIELTDHICEALKRASALDSASITLLKKKIVDGKVAPEDWLMMAENALEESGKEASHGN